MSASKNKLLAAAYHYGSANAIIPVIKNLQDQGKLEVVTLSHGVSKDKFKDAGIKYKTVQDYNLSDVSYDSMKTVLFEEKPIFVLTGTSIQDVKKNEIDIIEQNLILAARFKDIQTLAVLDYWGNYWQRFSDFSIRQKFRSMPSRIAIMDNYAKKEMLDEGFNKEILAVTGNPHFDSLAEKARHFSREDRERVREQIGLKNELIGFYACGVFKEDAPVFGYWDLDNIKIINETMQKTAQKVNANAGLVAKMHSRQPDSDYNEIVDYISNNSKDNIKLIPKTENVDVNQIILASDFSSTACSTVGIEATLMGKPFISLQPGLKTQDYLAIITKNEIAPVGYTEESCRGLVENIISHQHMREVELPKLASKFRTDGKATKRVTNLIYEMMKGNK